MKKKILLLSLVFMFCSSAFVWAKPHAHEHCKGGVHPTVVKPIHHHCHHYKYPRVGFSVSTGGFRYIPSSYYDPYLIAPYGGYNSYPAYCVPNLHFNVRF